MGEQEQIEQDRIENSKLIIRAAYESAKRDAMEEMRSSAKSELPPLLTTTYLEGYRRGRLHGVINTGLFFAVILVVVRIPTITEIVSKVYSWVK